MMKRVLSRCIRMWYLIWLLSNFLLTLRSEDEAIYALTMPTSCWFYCDGLLSSPMSFLSCSSWEHPPVGRSQRVQSVQETVMFAIGLMVSWKFQYSPFKDDFNDFIIMASKWMRQFFEIITFFFKKTLDGRNPTAVDMKNIPFFHWLSKQKNKCCLDLFQDLLP